ncbi:CDP-glycerol glycerophosphotransferase family protein [Streptomyces sp. NBC_00237]|uniref:bifunctional glycosyltransferase/CDP-glycerol:glycerophosphate glycerophosphotransferase n=1 Tax=Streptomyces sp. NBC_00237 TaxID=2975687 RepID=UPI00225C1E05|nr:CDP-glycerol glycerophosphotransferase family protein [Streptomyces sp. NBC_00237]MCX5200866.1 CDP-glycerol glycerophosphotransferase family protein [Streptomyces sp. NBC_00237]
MPRFSVIVPAYQVQEYLEECLDSVLTQSFDDFELIAVDDCSPDACGDLIDEYAARDPRVRPLHLAENGGLGNARNQGMERARGDYLLFLDSDDTLTPGALQSISDRLKEADSPDVLVFDYARTFWTGEVERNQFSAELHEEGPASFPLADRPGLLRVLMVAWNKAYRRDFVEREDFTFPSGYYEDTPWTYPVLLAASSVSTLDEVCVHYRQRRQGNILSTTSLRHFDLFDQYDRVFAFLDSRPELAGWRPVIYRRMIDHFGTVFTRPGRLPRGSRAEFFRRARAHCRRYRTTETASRFPARPRGIASRSAAARRTATSSFTPDVELPQARHPETARPSTAHTEPAHAEPARAEAAVHPPDGPSSPEAAPGTGPTRTKGSGTGKAPTAKPGTAAKAGVDAGASPGAASGTGTKPGTGPNSPTASGSSPDSGSDTRPEQAPGRVKRGPAARRAATLTATARRAAASASRRLAPTGDTGASPTTSTARTAPAADLRSTTDTDTAAAPARSRRTSPRTAPGTAAGDAATLRLVTSTGPGTGVGAPGPAFRSSGAPAAPRIAAPSPRTRLRQALVRLGSHRTYRALALAQAVRRTVTSRTRALLRAVRSAAMQLHYRVQLRLPVREDQAVFAAYWNRGYSCNPAAIEAKVRELAPHVRTAWITGPAHAHTVPTGTRRLRPGSATYWSALARAKYLVNNVNFDQRLAKRPGQVLLQTQHGTPLKSMGLDLQDRPAAAMDFEQLLANTDKWDYLLSSNRHSSLVWGRAYPSAYTTLEHGYPRNDVFQNATADDVARIRESLNIPEGFTAVLYAPTHRDYRRTQRLTLDLERIARSLGPRHVILARAHYFANGPLHRPSSHSSARIVDVSEHHSIESLCLASDALITDYSSLMFDYANLDRPIVLHIDDWEAYEAARGTYFDIRDFPPGAIARTEDELIDIFRTGHWRGSRSAQLRTAFRNRFCPYDDGHAAERVVRRVFLGQTEGLPRFVPLEDRTPAPAPGSTGRSDTYPGSDSFPAASDPAASEPVLPAQQDARTTAQAVTDLLPAELR